MAKQERLRKEENERAAEASKEQGLPELIGTEKQVAWANTVRQNVIKQIEENIQQLLKRATNAEEAEKRMGIALISIKNKKSASWWIDHRGMYQSDIIHLLAEEYKAVQVAVNEAPTEVVEEISNEATIYPENPKTSTVAEIRPLEGKIEIIFPERRDDFRELVKGQLKMSWTGNYWTRELFKKNGTVQDRAAEAGHRLLAAGFPVRIFDIEIREKAIAGEYEPECTRWVQARTSGKYEGWFAINWDRRDDFYKAARAIGGSKWDRPSVVVPPEKFAEVLDFAEMYDFRVSEAARKLAEAARQAKDAALVAQVDAPPEREAVVASNKPPVLEVPEKVEIADEFRD